MHAFYDFTVCYNFSYVIDQASSLVNFFLKSMSTECFCLGSHALHFISFFLRKPTSASVLG